MKNIVPDTSASRTPSWCIGQNGITSLPVPQRGKWERHDCLLQVKNSFLGWGVAWSLLVRVKGGMMAVEQAANSLCYGSSMVSILAINPLHVRTVFLSSIDFQVHCLVFGTSIQHFQQRSGPWCGNFSAVAKSCHKYYNIECTKSWKTGNRKIWGQGQFIILNPGWWWGFKSIRPRP